ncbi:prolyl oligopeptidase family serine peptidase [uncultured Flavobacterium sp.]|uniref:S9 family peptidase n=1 Tax=uncultured Flavobacterium sp. TaxID=165435 RepID=UPI0025F410CD|nr:prolyl oligopeptidase family serine peptidase [uncultured Flavobacterium sp.]
MGAAKLARGLLCACLPWLSAAQGQQAGLKDITPEAYGKWGTLSAGSLSDDGRWIAYRMAYAHADTLFVQHCRTGQRLAFAEGKEALFSPDSRRAAIAYSGGRLLVQELDGSGSASFSNVSKFECSREGGFLAVLAGARLSLLTAKGRMLSGLLDLSDFSISASGTVAALGKGGVFVLPAASGFQPVPLLRDSTSAFKRPSWSRDGSQLAFFGTATGKGKDRPESKIYWHSMASGRLAVLDFEKEEALQGLVPLSGGASAPVFSEDGQRLFFSAKPAAAAVSPSTLVEVWDSSAPLDYPLQALRGAPELRPRLYCWTAASGRVLRLGSAAFPKAFLTGSREHAVSVSEGPPEPESEGNSKADYTITDLCSGATVPFLRGQGTEPGSMLSSPDGSLIAYHRDGDWHTYGPASGNHTNITKGMEAQFSTASPGWSADSKFLVLHDAHDVWLISGDGLDRRRLTKGREGQAVFRICGAALPRGARHPNDFFSQTFDLASGVIFTAAGKDKKSGFYAWSQTKGLEEIAYADSMADNIRTAPNSKTYAYMEQTAQLPPRLVLASPGGKRHKVLYQSNAHSTSYKSGAAKLVAYRNSKGEALQGALFYPADYCEGQQYPMVVQVYEQPSGRLHEYSNPSAYSNIGFSRMNYTADGYFVLYPDISYEIGNPGPSILDCVTSAVGAVLRMGVADRDRIGLLGHSFGGYEACYLVGHTTLFAAAVAGAAVSDMAGGSLKMDFSTGRPRSWKFESGQYRMGMPLPEGLDAYRSNSPISSTGPIVTPLLSWAGKKDVSVDWEQSVALHLLLKRQHKKSLLLAYPAEGHVLASPEAQADLSARIKAWLDFYLKQK